MRTSGVVLIASAAILLSTACASTPPRVDMSESFRVLGRENDVRIDAQLQTNSFAATSFVSLVYEIENLGRSPIAFAVLEPTVDYLPDSRMITVGIGAEIPRDDALPKMVRIAPGERRAFTAGARLSVGAARVARFAPRYLQVKLHYLDEADPFQPYLDEATVDERLFRTWIDHIAAVVTNALPIRWEGSGRNDLPSASMRYATTMP